MKSKSGKSTTASLIGMSSDVDEDQVLPDSLQKLEIVSVYSQSLAACKTNNERNRNPFFTELSTTNSIDDRITKDLFGPSCSNCKNTDKPCIVNSMNSIGSDMENRIWPRHRGNNSNSNSSSSNNSGTGQDIVHSINKTIHFKHRDREKASPQLLSEKKLAILREPILKSIGRSVYHNGNQSKSCCEPKSCSEHKSPKDERIIIVNAATAGAQAEVVTHASATIPTGAAASASGCQKSCNRYSNDGVTVTDGARGTVTECQNDSSTSNKISCQHIEQTNVTDPNTVMIDRIQNWRLADDVNVLDFKSLVTECNSLTLCSHGTSNRNPTIELHKTRNFQILQANQMDDLAAAGTSSSDINDSLNLNIHAANGNNAMHCGLNSSSSSSSSNSSSCSQQARMNSSNCDVTIDELASYIEFQLHLPKPMSSNVYEAMFS